MSTTLSASLRNQTGKGPNRRLRTEGRVPGILYGNGNDPTPLSFDPKEVVKLLEGPLGRNSVTQIDIDGAQRMAIVKDLQVHPWKRKLLHVDFMEITPETKLVLKVPFRRVGNSPMEKLGAKVEQHRDAMRIRCVAANIPAAIEFDMTTLTDEFAEVMASDLTMPEGVEPMYRKDFKLIRMKVSARGDVAEGEGDEEAAESEE